MPRRTWQDVPDGKLYAVEWPEWHVDCADKECDEHLLVAVTGEALNARHAERIMRSKKTGDDSDKWIKINGLWYCSNHATKKKEKQNKWLKR